MSKQLFTSLFIDVGGVLLTNGWDRHMREKASYIFELNYEEMNKRHNLIFDTYEIGKISLDEYLKRVVFDQERSFSIESFKKFMFEQSQPFDEMIDFIKKIKKDWNLQIVVVSNEGRELMQNRIDQFKMKAFVDIFVVSGFVHLRKPDSDIYQLALDLAQVKPEQVIYIDDRPLLTEIGKHIGMTAIQHQNYEQTKMILDSLLKR
ncbi:HAD-IA family hydrolase [Candidatus Protochlamydia sp. R18]|uniref:HAD-IA family hydrolase n=1 Tax=Candidatus Protochlamydia sp. R18 TaxID=1353977 RepID=UPI0005A9B329|nr:HAD-IA family hydrolase [Candidatus Protochlamydia sp. R18]